MSEDLSTPTPTRPMPSRDQVDPMFDGHPEREWTELSATERLDWLWTCMELFRLGEATREAQRSSIVSGGRGA